jgi:hypothetical protein
MKGRRLVLALALGLGLVLAGLFAFGGLAAPMLRPGNPVLSPAANANAAPRDGAVSITYDEDINPSTASTETFAVHAMQSGLLAETLGVNGDTIALTPAQPFKPGELVQATATTGTLNFFGEGPISSTVWQFRAAVGVSRGVFTSGWSSASSTQGADVALGDLDGDGDLDTFVANVNQANQVWLNEGGGVFTDSLPGLGSSDSRGIALGDLDGNGTLDAFVANRTPFGQANKVWLNDGSGAFSDSGQGLGSSPSYDVSLGDLDGDGDLDAFVANYTQANRVWKNDGTGAFVDLWNDAGTDGSLAVALGDVDGDGDLDAFVVNDGAADQVWVNDGRGIFSAGWDDGATEDSVAVALGDVDGDGDLDALVGDETVANRLWINQGGSQGGTPGAFSDSGQSLGTYQTEDVALGDVDGDGDLDIFVAIVSSISEPNKVWRNDGTGVFTDSLQNLGSARSYAAALGDVNGDGALDAFVANSGQPDQVWLNTPYRVYLPVVLKGY